MSHRLQRADAVPPPGNCHGEAMPGHGAGRERLVWRFSYESLARSGFGGSPCRRGQDCQAGWRTVPLVPDPTGTTGPGYARNIEQNVVVEDGPVNSIISQNVIGDSAAGGVRVDSFGKSPTSTRIEQNRIGVSSNGTPISNGPYGVSSSPNGHGDSYGSCRQHLGVRPQPRRSEVAGLSAVARTSASFLLTVQGRHSATKRSTSACCWGSRSAESSGCHCTPTTHGALECSTPSTIPSVARAVTTRPSPTRSIA